MRKLFQTGSPCFPFPLNSKIHNLIQVTVIFGWHSQKFAYPEDKPCIPCPGVVSGLHQRSNRRATYEVQLTAGSTRVFLAEKKGSEVEIDRGISLHSVLELFAITLFYQSHLHSEYFCYDWLFLQKTWVGYCWVLRLTSECQLWSWLTDTTGHLPALAMTFCTKILIF